MKNLLPAFIIGSIISIMVSINGLLSSQYTMLEALLIIQAVGLMGMLLVYSLSKKEKKVFKLPIFYYISGVIGVVLTFSNNLCFKELGVTLTLGLGLLGQTSFSLVIDTLGLFGREKSPLSNNKILGNIMIAVGLFIMVIS